MLQSVELIKKIVEESKSLRDAAKKLETGHSHLKRHLIKLKIDFSHFYNRDIKFLVGKKFNMLTVISVRRSGEIGDSRRRSFALCNCDCGKTKEVRIDSLKEGRYISCGCHSKNRWNTVASLNHQFSGFGEIRGSYYSDLKRNAKKRGLEFNISIEELWDVFQKQEGICPLTGVPISFGRIYFPNETSASPDRIDNSVGYISGNVRWVLKDINMIRKGYDSEYFINLCNLVAKKNPRDVSLKTIKNKEDGEI